MIDKAWPQTLVEIHGVVNRISLKNISDATFKMFSAMEPRIVFMSTLCI